MCTLINKFLPPFRLLQNTDTKNLLRHIEYANKLLIYVISAFNWDLKDLKIPEYIPECLLAFNGHIGVFKQGDDVTIAAGQPAGKPNKYGVFGRYIATTWDGETFEGTTDKDVVIIPNNSLYVPDWWVIQRYSEMLSQTDISLMANIRYTRETKFFRVDTEKERQAIKKAISDSDSGEPVVAVSTPDRVVDDLLANGQRGYDVFDLTDPKDTDKLQYLSRFYDDLMSRFLRTYGIDVENVNKGSQILSDELHGFSNAAAIPTEDKFKCRVNACKKIKDILGIDIDVTMSDLYNYDTKKRGDEDVNEYNEQRTETDSVVPAE